jgi:4-amino-4-deoxy-L-arabinose transferase-like glycosyltransferase
MDRTLTEQALVADQTHDNEASGVEKRQTRVLLIGVLLIIGLALLLRLIRLTENPPGFYCDEATFALDSYSIAHTLRDRHHVLFPTYIQGLGQWHGALYFYILAPFMALLGLSEFTVRFASATIGTLTVWLAYIGISRATNRWVGLIAAFLLAISPWHIMQSRIGWDEVSVPLITLLFLLGVQNSRRNPNWIPVAFATAALGMYAYFPGRLFFPLFGLITLIIYWPELKRQRKMLLAGMAVALIIVIPSIIALLNGSLLARYHELHRSLTLSQQAAAFLHNYATHFSLEFLFTGPSYEKVLRDFIPGFGMLYLFELPFLLLGIAVLLTRRERFDLLCLGWFVIYPIAASLVRPAVATRSITGVLLFQIVVALGIYKAGQILMAKVAQSPARRPQRRAIMAWATGLFLIVSLMSTLNFATTYFGEYPRYAAGWMGWQWGARQVFTTAGRYAPHYDRVLINHDFDGDAELLQFYSLANKLECENCRLTSIPAASRQSADYRDGAHLLWVLRAENFNRSFLSQVPHRVVTRIAFPYGNIAFLFIETGPPAKAAHSR